MKRFGFVFIALCFVVPSFSQVDFTFFAGPHASTVKYLVKGKKQETNYKYGFQAGGGCKIFFDKNLYFSPSISYNLLGYKVTFNQPSFPPDLLAKNNNTTFHQVDINLMLHLDLSDKPNHFFLEAGPSFNFILSGKEQYDLITGGHVSRSMKFSTINNYGRYEVSVTPQLGFEMGSGFFVSANYSFGLISLNNELDGPKIFNRGIGLSFGKILRKKKIVLNKSKE